MADKEFKFNKKDFQFISDLVGEKVGIMLPERKRDMVYGRIARRLRVLKMTTFKEYCEYIDGKNGEEEIVNFVNAITTNLTKFFREGHHFEHMRDVVFPEYVAKPPVGKQLLMWSAGCSSGMEAYSLAMTAHDAIPNISNWNIKILATDIDTNMINKGKDGIYRKSDGETIPVAYRNRYTSTHGGRGSDEIIVSEKLRELVFFKYMNFLDEWPIKKKFDVIFCRNVVIYFDKELQRVLFNKFADVLKPNGWLYIGHSENISCVAERFSNEGRTIYRKCTEK